MNKMIEKLEAPELDPQKFKYEITQIAGKIYKASFKTILGKHINITLAKATGELTEVKTGEIIDEIVLCAERHTSLGCDIEHHQQSGNILIKCYLSALADGVGLSESENIDEATSDKLSPVTDAKVANEGMGKSLKSKPVILTDEIIDDNNTKSVAESTKKRETKAQKFKRLGSDRLNKTINSIRILSNMANTASYEYTEDQVERILSALRDAVSHVEGEFYNEKKDTPLIEL